MLTSNFQGFINLFQKWIEILRDRALVQISKIVKKSKNLKDQGLYLIRKSPKRKIDVNRIPKTEN
jgi:hypothetical protein